MNADNPSIYDFRDNEVEAARQIRRERIMNAIAAPFAFAALVAWAIVFACL